MARTVWQDHFIIDAYNLSRAGLTEPKMAEALGISLPTFRVWEKKKKLFAMSIKMGRDEYRGVRTGQIITFQQFVYKRLPKDLRKVWRQINKLDHTSKGQAKVEYLLANQGKRARQHLFLYAWTASNFSISEALRKINLSRDIFAKWKQEENFAKLVEEINWHKKNFFEEHLCRLVQKGDTSATIFVNKTYNRDRGYNEKVDINMNVSGQVEHRFVPIRNLELSLECKKELLASLRKTQQPNP